MSLNGANELFRTLRAIDAVLENPEQVLGKAAETIRSGCVLECPVNDGELRNKGIKTRVEGDKGYVYTTLPYAQYVEFGTGRKGAADHAGISPYVHPSYTMEPWWIPEDKLSEGAIENYHWVVIEVDGKRYYRSDGQPAQPFMYQGAKKTEKKAVKDAGIVISQLIEKD
ncbi:HK97 gp10 family phage protein [Coprobacillus sp. K06]|uniref:HK97-gp10 family putative phage morphogenesis protein n=1 Tax=Coprobacillus sp. K06 TaxID=2718930 RepID=UPI001C8CA2DB|nr:HK97-gp10 family putative phage morphogenesis protein [Coprobacillus sp. K06]MBX9163530.1 HK97 gp10 family phage protein [Coprobacillus sp. K06]